VNAVAEGLADGAVVLRRNLVKIWRVPEILLFTLVSPIMFVLLFAYVFGSAIELEGTRYREFLIAGVFAQTVVFGSTWTGASLAEDMQKGVIDRFRSLPMARSAVLVGRTAGDVVINVLSIAVMVGAGLVVGWRIRTSVWEAAEGFLQLLFFAYCFSWIMAYVGLLVPGPEVVNNASFVVIFPMTFIANTFVPLERLPGPLKVFAEWNPVSAVTHATRELFGNGAGVRTPSDAWPISHPVLYTLIWGMVILAVFVPLSTRAYRLTAKR
jgi:ABC transporter DrrB family efflux protein